MRALPAGWPDPSDPHQTTPKVYLHMLDGTWPAASVQDGESLPDGWTLVGDWEFSAALDAPLLPGQVNSSTNFTVASGTCMIPQPVDGLVAPWRPGSERTPIAGRIELIASHDGYNGATAFLLGQFVLDPIKGRLSSPVIELSFAQDLIRLNKPHDLPATTSGITVPVSPTRFLEAGAAANDLTLDATADFPALVTSSYFPGKMSEKDAMKSIVAANLGALYMSMDGTTLRVLDADALLGGGVVDDTLQVLDDFEDLVWTQDPNAAVDRIEISYLPPSYVSVSDDGRAWSAPKGVVLAPGDSVTYSFDPKRAALPFTAVSPGGALYPKGNTSPLGTGTVYPLTPNVTELSSGSIRVELLNNNPVSLYLMEKYYPAGTSGTDDGYPRGTTSFLRGTVDAADDQATKTLTWGAASEDAANTLTFDLGRNIQRASDAQAILDRIVTRVSGTNYIIDDVRVLPHVGRELGDLYRVQMEEAGLDTRALVTAIKLSGSPGGIQQSVTIAALPLTLSDFDEAWDAAMPGATLNDFDAVWDATMPGAIINDFDFDPLRT